MIWRAAGMLVHFLLFSSILGTVGIEERKVGEKEPISIHSCMMVYREESKDLMWNHPMTFSNSIEYMVCKS